MKKVLVILAAAGFLFAMSSCNKNCTCKTYVDGQVKLTVEDFEPDEGKKCADYNTVVEVNDKKNGVECR